MSPRPFAGRIIGTEDRAAEQNRARLDLNRVLALNLIGPPGAGKAALVRRTAEALAGRARVAVVSTSAASDPVSELPTVRLDVGRAPHVTPADLGRALASLPLHELDLVVVENVGDFVCPATYRLGTHLNVRISTPFEDDRRPHEHPQLFTGLDALVLNKTDRMAEGGFDSAIFRRALDALNPNLVLIPVSCATGSGIAEWAAWLDRSRATRVLSRRSEPSVPARPDARAAVRRARRDTRLS